MKVNFNESETKNNLMRAFAGESQARNRYTFGSSMAKKENLHVISEIFLYTANQEKEHAEIFYNHLKELSGESITVDGICLNCGHVHNWKEAPKKCPVCDHNRGYFIRLELSPFEK